MTVRRYIYTGDAHILAESEEEARAQLEELLELSTNIGGVLLGFDVPAARIEDDA
jgi:hypothetical protein